MHDALSFARQITDALEAAHEKGIVHRDLKPANIALSGEPKIVKVLDFGLAKTPEADGVEATSDRRTLKGMMIRTPPYMSPEQARGQPIDKRTDIWAFGCVLYEMLAGEKVFRGDTASDILAAVLNSGPDWSVLPAATPPNVRRLLERCLEKDQRCRLHDIADARLELDDALTGRSKTTQPDRKTVSRRWRVAAVIGGLLLAATGGRCLSSPRPRVPTFTELSFQRGRIGGARFAANGTAAVYSAANEGRPLDVVRVDLEDSPSPRLLNYPPGSDVLAGTRGRGGAVAPAAIRRGRAVRRHAGPGSARRRPAPPIGGQHRGRGLGRRPRTVGRRTLDRRLVGPERNRVSDRPAPYMMTGSIRFLRVSRATGNDWHSWRTSGRAAESAMYRSSTRRGVGTRFD